MKRFAKSVLGVTLLEIMLVLAIASMIIVMSIRYYQSASQSNQANTFIQQVQSITAADESLAQGSTYGAVTTAQITSILPTNGLMAPWGGTAMTFTPTASGYSLAVSTPPVTAVCALVATKLNSNSHYNVPAGCGTVTYNANL